jgi:O-antigen biosynthesis protein
MSKKRFNPLDHLIGLEPPSSQAPSRWSEHVPFVMYLVGALEPHLVVDLAASDGALYLGVCQAIDALKLDTEAFAVRPRQVACDDGLAAAAAQSLDEPRYARFSRVLEATVDQSALHFDSESIDLLRIGGDREVELVEREFQSWHGKMSRFGLVLIDCVARRSGNLGVSQLWEELSRRFPSFLFDHGPGLGVLCVGEDGARVFSSLVGADADDADRIRRFFASLGKTYRERATSSHVLEVGPSRGLSKTVIQAERIDRLMSALRDSQRRLKAADERLAMFEARMASRTWRIADHLGHAATRLAPGGSKRRALIGTLSSALGARARAPGPMARSLRTITDRVRHSLPGIGARRVRQRLHAVLDFIRFHWEVHSSPPAFTPFTSARASVVIPDADETTSVLACLRSIAQTAPGVTFELIMVDASAKARTSRALRRAPGISVVANPDNDGFARCCNRGAALARGDYLVFLRSAAIVAEGWLAELAGTFDELCNVGLVVPKVIDSDGRLKDSVLPSGGQTSALGQSVTHDPEHPRYNYVRELETCSDACMMIPTALFHGIGGFDSARDAEDAGATLAHQVRQAGYRVLYQPAAQIIDGVPMANRGSVAKTIAASQAINPPHFGGDLRKLDWPAPRSFQGPFRDRVARGSVTGPSRKGRVLVIDYSLPTPDQDAGSVRMVEILKAIRARGNHVTFIPADLTHRTPYAQNLQRIGVEVVYQPFYSCAPDYLEQHGQEFDLIILSRADVASRFVESARRCAPQAKLFFDTVDLHFLREERAAELMDSPRLRKAARRRKRQELVLTNQCDVTVVVSPVEKAILERECPGSVVRVVPTVVDVPRDEPPGFDDRQNVLFIGGFAHAPNVDAVVYFVEEVLPHIVEQLPDVIFQVVGSNTPAKIRELSGKNVEVLGFVPDVKPLLERARVSVAPLRFGAGVKGKVNHSMAYGIPTVVSSIAAEGMHLVHEYDAMIADLPATTAGAVVRLYTSRELWERVSANGRENVQKHFSVESVSRQIDELLAFAGLGDRMPSRREAKLPSLG